MKKYALSLFLLACAAASLPAQVASDALRYSVLSPSGTARFMGAGGAFGALGADFGSISQNPAGLALYRSNELVLTPALRFAKSTAQLDGTQNVDFEDEKSAFGFDNFGLVFNTNRTNKHWKTFNVALGVNRQAKFAQSSYYEGKANGSILNGFFADAQATLNGGGTAQDLYPFGAGLAWNANAIYYQDNVLSYDLAANPSATLNRSHTVTTHGGINEMLLGFAGNYDEKLMVGMSIGVPFVNYRLEGDYTEQDPEGALGGTVDYFDRLSYTDYLRTEGLGINVKMGLVYKVNQMIRLGGHFHSPTFMSLTDNFSNTFQYAYEDGSGPHSSNVESSGDGTSDYKLRTPWRAGGSAAVVLKKYGFLSADLEYVDYSDSRFNLNPDVPSTATEALEREVNADIQRLYRGAVNLRVGGEAALDNFRLRAGVNFLGNPIEGKDDDFRKVYSVGAGVHSGKFYLDVAFRRLQGTGSLQAYADAPAAVTDNSANDILLTLGFKF